MNLAYSVLALLIGSGLTDREIDPVGTVLTIRAPLGASVTVKVGSAGADPIPLSSGEWMQIPNDDSELLFITASGSGTVHIVQGLCVSFFRAPAADVVDPVFREVWYPKAGSIGGAFQPLVLGPPGVSVTQEGWSGASGAGAESMQLNNSLWCVRWNSNKQRTFGPPLVFPTDSGPQASTYLIPAPFRVWRLEFPWAMFSPNPISDAVGVTFAVSDGGLVNLMTGGTHGFGIVGDGAAGWRYVEKNVGGASVYSYSQSLAWPVALDEWATVAIELTAAAGGDGASLTVDVNGVRLVSRSWGATSTLPVLAGADWCFRLGFHQNNGAAGGLYYLGSGLTLEAGAL